MLFAGEEAEQALERPQLPMSSGEMLLRADKTRMLFHITRDLGPNSGVVSRIYQDNLERFREAFPRPSCD